MQRTSRRLRKQTKPKQSVVKKLRNMDETALVSSLASCVIPTDIADQACHEERSTVQEPCATRRN